MSRTILVFGRSGQIARELAKVAPHSGVGIEFAGRDRCDLAAGAPFGPLLDAISPAVVINAAAYTAVDKAEAEPQAAFRLNAEAPGEMAQACTARDIPFIHFSSDYVFDGLKPAPYVEDDRRAPLGVYGASKAAGEDAVLAAGGRAVILRTSWVYSAFGANFIKTMLRLLDRTEVAVVDDQLGRPTWAEDCARAALTVASALNDGDPRALGLFHVSGGGDATWADFAEAIFARAAAGGLRAPRVRRIATAEYPTPARRPANSRLDCGKIERALGWRARPWRDSLAACMAEMEPLHP